MKSISLSLVLLLFVFICSSCGKDEVENIDTLKMLYKTYKDGEIQECSTEGETFYLASRNIVDSPGMVFDHEGSEVGECNPAWGRVDPICEQLTTCEVIYRTKDHISGEPAVDKYGLGR